MDVLPRVSFFSSMIPIAPPVGHWKKHKLISKFIWNGKKPCLKWTALQQDKTQGGLSLPD